MALYGCPQERVPPPHRHSVFSIPKILRRYFLFDRKLLADLSRCAWESLKVLLQEAVGTPCRKVSPYPAPRAIVAIQTFSDVLGFNPHGQSLVTDGFFYDMTLLSLNSGLRFGGIASLTWQDVDLERGTLTIRDAKAGSRYAFLTEQAQEMLKNRSQCKRRGKGLKPGIEDQVQMTPVTL